MKKLYLILACVSLPLGGCETAAFLAKPAPLSQTTIDEKGFLIALQTFDTVLTVIDKMVANNVIKPGTGNAADLAVEISRAKKAFLAANEARKVGNASSYAAALLQAQSAITQINLMLRSW